MVYFTYLNYTLAAYSLLDMKMILSSLWVTCLELVNLHLYLLSHKLSDGIMLDIIYFYPLFGGITEHFTAASAVIAILRLLSC